jgi:hypothetical protein
MIVLDSCGYEAANGKSNIFDLRFTILDGRFEKEN